MDSCSLPIGNAGGPPGRGSFGSNPQWSIRVPVGGSRIQVECRVAKDLAANVIIARCGNGCCLGEIPEQKSKRIHHLYEDPVLDTGKYRHGYTVAEAAFVPAGLYTLVVSTIEVGLVGNFSLRVLSSKEIDLSELDGDPLPVHSLVGDTAARKDQLQFTDHLREHRQDGEIERCNVLSPKPLTIPKHSHQDATTHTNIAQQGASNTSTTHPITSSPTTTQPSAANPTHHHSTISTHGKTPHPVVGIAPPLFFDIWVDPVSGNDANGGATRDQALRTLSKAWRHVLLNEQGLRINLVEGDYPEATVPNVWEDHTGTFATPVMIIAADGVGTARLPAMNLTRCRHFHLDGLTISAASRAVLHFEAWSDIRLRNVTVLSTVAVATNGVTGPTAQTVNRYMRRSR